MCDLLMRPLLVASMNEIIGTFRSSTKTSTKTKFLTAQHSAHVVWESPKKLCCLDIVHYNVFGNSRTAGTKLEFR